MLLRKACGGNATKAAVGAHLVEILAPGCNDSSGLRQRLEPVLVQAFVAELAVEALDVAVLHRPPGLNQDVPDAVTLSPGHEGPAGELRAVVRAHGTRVAAEPRGLVQQPCNVLARDPKVGADLHALMADVICHGSW